MPVDTSIYSNIQPFQQPNQLNQLAAIGQIQATQGQNRLAELQFQQAQRANDQAEGLNNIWKSAIKPDGTIDRNVLFTGAAQGGYGSAIPALQKQFADADKAQADVAHTKAQTGEVDAKTLNMALQQGRDILTQVNDPAAGRQWLISQFSNPVSGKVFQNMGTLDQALARYDQQTASPEGFARWKQGAMLNAENLVKYTTPDANAVLAAKTSRENNRDTVGAMIRGQNLTDARARDQIEQGRIPSGYRRAADGNLEAIPGGPAEKDKAPTEFQGKNAVFGSRAEAADKILTDLTGDYSVGGVNLKSSSKGALGTAMNYALSPNSQKAEQAQRDFINAVLRQESGAAISESEFDNARKQYFPQPGDSQAVIAQKAANRKLVVQGFKDNSGPLAKKSFGQSAPAASPAVPSDINDLLKKYGG